MYVCKKQYFSLKSVKLYQISVIQCFTDDWRADNKTANDEDEAETVLFSSLYRKWSWRPHRQVIDSTGTSTCEPFPVFAGISVPVEPWRSQTDFSFLLTWSVFRLSSRFNSSSLSPLSLSLCVLRTSAVCPTCRSHSPPSAWTSSSPEESRRL